MIVGSALLVVSVGERLTQLGSMATRESVAQVIRDAGLGTSLSDGLAAYRVGLMVLAGCAAAALVLGWQVGRRSRGARVGLSVLAVPIFVGGTATSAFLASAVAAAVAILWVGPSAAWLRGDAVAASATPLEPPRAARTAASAREVRVPEHRPDAVIWACVLTWSFCALASLVLAGSIALMALKPSLVFDQVDRSDPGLLGGDISRTELVHATYVTGGLGIAWAIAASLLAVFAWRRAAGARTGLVVSAAATAVIALLGTATSVVMLVPGVVAVVSLSLLNTAEVRAWYAAGARSRPRGPMAP